MKLLSSLRSRIFLASALLVVLSTGAAIYLVSVRVTGELESSLQREIASTGRLVEQLRTTRAQTFTMMARLIADAPKLKAAVDTNDPPTVQNNANDYQAQLQSNLLLVTNKSGVVLATFGASPRAALVVASQPAVRDALAGHEGFSLIPQAAGILQLVTVPIAIGLTRPEILGTLSVGFLLDDGLAGQLKEVTGSEIAFGMDGQILASTLPREQRPALAELLRRGEDSSDVRLEQEDYVALRQPLAPTLDGAVAGAGPVALILRSRTEQLRFLQALHTELLGTAIMAVILGTLLSFAVARTITRPLAAITGVMRDVAATGDLTRKIVLTASRRWDDEDARLLATTFNALTDSVARVQREMSQKERLSSLGRLSTVIAHEVRNPLMIIKAALHTLRREGLDAAAIREVARDIDEEVARLNRIVNEVLDFARPIHFDLAAADLNALCRESAAAAQATPGPSVELSLDPTLPPIVTDAERLRVALVNLLVNARHAVDAPARELAVGQTSFVAVPIVSLSTRRQPNVVTIGVLDNGGGIEGIDLPRVFDPYFTTKRGGTGLGLPIAKNIVEGLGGTIAVTSRLGTGTEIRIEFPLSFADGTPS
jgi:signal transduction histidine kinase